MENIQNYNRYSYCVNNPLKYLDPNGYNFWDWLFNRNSCKRTRNPTNKTYDPPKRDTGSSSGGSRSSGNSANTGSSISYSSGFNNYIPGIRTSGYNGVSVGISGNRSGSSSVSGLSMKPDVLDPKSGGRIHGPMANESHYFYTPSAENCGASSFEIIPNLEEALKYIDDGCDHENSFL